MFCENCGAKIADNDMFCQNCGKRVEFPATQPIPEQNVSQAEPEASAQIQSKLLRQKRLLHNKQQLQLLSLSSHRQIHTLSKPNSLK